MLEYCTNKKNEQRPPLLSGACRGDDTLAGGFGEDEGGADNGWEMSFFTRSKIFKPSFTQRNLSYPWHFATLVQTAVVDLRQRLAQPIGFVSAWMNSDFKNNSRTNQIYQWGLQWLRHSWIVGKNFLGFGSGLGIGSLTKRYHRRGVCRRCSKFGLFIKVIFFQLCCPRPLWHVCQGKGCHSTTGPSDCHWHRRRFYDWSNIFHIYHLMWWALLPEPQEG